MNESKEKRKTFYQRRQRPSRVKGKYGVVIPALNEADTIGGVVKGIRRLGLSAIVVDDGSKDATASMASSEGAVVISHIQTRGKGSAVRAGIDYVLRKDFDAVIKHIQDGKPIFGTPKRTRNPLTARDGEGISVCTPTFTPISNQLRRITNKEKT